MTFPDQSLYSAIFTGKNDRAPTHQETFLLKLNVPRIRDETSIKAIGKSPSIMVTDVAQQIDMVKDPKMSFNSDDLSRD